MSHMMDRFNLAARLSLAAVFAGVLVAPAVAQAPAANANPASGRFSQPEPMNWDDHNGWVQIFDGKTLTGWDGPSEVWSVEDGSIVGKSSDEHPSGTTNIIWRAGGEIGNFKLKLEMKLDGAGANGGIQYRSANVPPMARPMTPEQIAAMKPEQKARFEKAQELSKAHAKWNLKGYQADFDYSNKYSGQLYEQDSPRGIIAWPGQAVETEQGHYHRLFATLGTPEEMRSYIKVGDWNQVEIIADGHTLTHVINGHVMSVTVDTDPAYAAAKGLIAFEIEGGGTLKISHRNIWLKKLP